LVKVLKGDTKRRPKGKEGRLFYISEKLQSRRQEVPIKVGIRVKKDGVVIGKLGVLKP